MRVILYTGKGGVGKTTLSAATGVHAAKMGYRTLVISTDPAHSLADSFNLPLQSEPTPIMDNLWGQEINLINDIHRFWGDLQDSLRSLFLTKGFDDIVAEELAVMPGMEEVCAFLHLNEKIESGQFDCIILDCAPTGETIRLISLPDIIEWYIEKLFSISRTATGILQPVIKTALFIQNDAIYKAIDKLFGGVKKVQKRLMNQDETSIRIVLNPEKMVMKEALRSYSYFTLFGYNVDSVILNRVLEPIHNQSFFENIRKIQQRYIPEITASFAPLPVNEVPLIDQEVFGIEMLEYIGNILFKKTDPTAIHFKEKIQEIEKTETGYILKRRFPSFEKTQLSLRKIGDELIVTIGNVRRSIILPRSLANLEPIGGDFTKGHLIVRFEKNQSS